MINSDSVWLSGDERLAINELNGIYDYVREQRKLVDVHPDLLPLIASFEGWYGGLEEGANRGIGPLDPGLYRTKVGLAEVNEAKRRREAINAVLGEHIPDNRVPADSPQTPADKPPPSPVESAVNAVVTVAVVGGLGWALIKLLTGREK